MELPKETFRDYINELRLDIKYKYIPFRGYYRIRSYRHMYNKAPEMGLLKFIVDPSRNSVDVGASLGLFTYFLARYSVHVYAFEPNPLPLRYLRTLVDDNVTVVHGALSDFSGEVELSIRRNRRGWTCSGARIGESRGGTVLKVKVPCSRLDDLGYSNIGFIKIDVQGHEKAVLTGARRTIERDRPNLFLENEYAVTGEAMMDVFALMRDLDYDGFALIDGVLKNVNHFSIEEHQIKPREDRARRKEYVRNFIFIPK